jgi:uncharacterized protein (TIGR03437 family)
MRSALILMLVGVATAQPPPLPPTLATNDDGSALWFVSKLSQKGSGQPEHGKVFRVDGEGVHVAAMRPAPQPGEDVTDFYDLISVDVSGDGRVLAYQGHRDCTCCESCDALPKLAATITGAPGGEMRFTGAVRLSRNGKWALYFAPDNSLYLIDLSTGHFRFLHGGVTAPGPGRQIAADGTTVFSVGENIYLVGSDRVMQLPVSGTTPVIDDAATQVFFGSRPITGSILRVYNLRDGSQKQLTDQTEGFAVSADGSRVIARRLVRFFPDLGGWYQMFLVNLDGGGVRQITNTPRSASEPALSGDGKALFFNGDQDAIYRMDIDSGELTPLIARPAANLLGRLRQSPGSIVSMPFSGQAVQGAAYAQPPLPKMLGGLQVKIDGRPAPIDRIVLTDFGPDTLAFQVPWDTSTGVNLAVEVESAAYTVFEAPGIELQSVPFAPQFVFKNGFELQAIHEDFGSLVTAQSPARPGEIIHLYMTGLGPVTPAIADGEAGPANPPAVLVTPITCSVPDTAGMHTITPLFAGLAPALVGYYQVSIRLPDGPFLAERVFFSCGGVGDVGLPVGTG